MTRYIKVDNTEISEANEMMRANISISVKGKHINIYSPQLDEGWDGNSIWPQLCGRLSVILSERDTAHDFKINGDCMVYRAFRPPRF